jgi:rubrerythrin
MMSFGTDGISHSIHLAQVDDDGNLSNFQEYENVLDVMNLPDGTVKFNYENGLKEVKDGRIVRSRVRGIEDAFRYRCSECGAFETDVISQRDRGEQTEMFCPVCEELTDHSRMDVDEIKYDGVRHDRSE